ncbi:MAG TPA: Trk family potassium uptake protein [Clostridiales bacterium]|jgi:trk system potassium uptake protein TrkH|nr:Trk family potassium uptake protein [Clostridiales bacterium]
MMSNKPTHKKQALSPSKVLALGFLGIILLGTLLLSLPIASERGVSISPMQAAFTAASAVCVTGLTVVDTANSFSLFGEVVILCLIQIGGLGFMMFATTVLVLTKRRISLRNRILLHETMSMPGLSGTVRAVLRFMLIVFAVEFLGAVILSIQFIPRFGVSKGIYYGIFHAISAFCNAGFDLFGSAGSLSQFHHAPLVLIPVTLLIITGGLGFAVVADLISHGTQHKKLQLHTKVVVVMTAALLLLGTVFFALTEWHNPNTLAGQDATIPSKLLNAWFQSTTSRTAGFYSFDQGQLREGSKFATTLLMFIGASPASTGGGIKTSTLFVILVLLRSVFKGTGDVNAFKRRLPLVLVRTVLSVFLISLVLLSFGAILMSFFEEGRGHGFLDLVFEEASALATVGLSTKGTANYSMGSKIWLMLLMYFGRVGPLTMMLSFSNRHANQLTGIRYAEDNILVG